MSSILEYVALEIVGSTRQAYLDRSKGKKSEKFFSLSRKIKWGVGDYPQKGSFESFPPIFFCKDPKTALREGKELKLAEKEGRGFFCPLSSLSSTDAAAEA